MTSHRHPSLWANCERCEDLHPEDVFAYRPGLGWLCTSCDPGGTVLTFGIIIATNTHDRPMYIDHPAFTCIEDGCTTMPVIPFLSEQDDGNDEYIWLHACKSHLLQRIGEGM